MDVPVNPYRAVIDWLENTPEGERWSKRTHHVTGPETFLVTIKDDGNKGEPWAFLWMYEADHDRISDVSGPF